MKYEIDPAIVNFSSQFSFERNFVHQDMRSWMTDNWTYGFHICALYVLVVFLGRRYMTSRKAFDLRAPLVVWNTLLAIGSMIGAYRSVLLVFYVLRKYGVYHIICDASYMRQNAASEFWGWLFALSKVVELGDTAFIILRKQPLHFLHWYHHVTVLLYSWFSYVENAPTSNVFGSMNVSVHSLMYTYYALKAMRVSVPKPVAMVVTACQLAQMVVGCTVNYLVFQYLVDNKQECHVSWTNLKLSLAMYMSYFILFARFFYKSYFVDQRKPVQANGVTKSPVARGQFGKVKLP